MTVKEKQKLYLDFLKEKGYNCGLTSNGNIRFEYESAQLYIYMDETDENYFLLSFPSFWKINTSEEKIKSLIIGNNLNCDYKIAKIVLTGEDDEMAVSIDMGIYLVDVMDFKLFFPKMCDALITMATDFVNEMKEKK
jgi:hypothetical protein